MLNGVLQPDVVIEGILWDIQQLKQQLSSIEFPFIPCACGVLCHACGGYHMWDCFEPKWLFNSLASDINISIRI
ncbi:unnamed protein product [Malus baccata var. baccata]